MRADPEATVGLRRQLITCTVMCGLAAVLILAFHMQPHLPALLSGVSPPCQLAIGLALGVGYWALASIGNRFGAGGKSADSMAESYSRLDLGGWNPVWMALAAGFGEELLFRGALQPIAGIWVTSILFVLAHVRAYRFNTLSARVLAQAAGLFAVSLALCGVREYAGLITAMIIHAAMDIVGLYMVRRVVRLNALTAT